VLEYWSDAFRTQHSNTPILQHSNYVLLHLGERSLERSEMPKILHLEIFAG
jgi:hypothetical protein